MDTASIIHDLWLDLSRLMGAVVLQEGHKFHKVLFIFLLILIHIKTSLKLGLLLLQLTT